MRFCDAAVLVVLDVFQITIPDGVGQGNAADNAKDIGHFGLQRAELTRRKIGARGIKCNDDTADGGGEDGVSLIRSLHSVHSL